MTVLIVDNHTDYIDALKSLLKDFDVSVKSYMDLEIEDKDLFDLIILTGGYHRASVNENPNENLIEMELVKETNRPLIGICYGSQIIAETFGSKIEELPEKVIENKEIIFLEDFLDKKKNDKMVVHESHRYAIKQLSETFIPIAKSDDGFEIIKHKDKQIYGFQFHPEIEPELTSGDELFKKLLESI